MFGGSLSLKMCVDELEQILVEPDKVVEQLENYANEEMLYYKGTPYEKCIEVCMGKAIEIVKGGGVDAKTDF